MEQRNAACRVSGLVLANAMIFQEILSEADGRVQDLQTTLKKEHLQGAFTHQWEFIV
ncbi:MAG: hypothetical protein HY304_01780, partial [candidate division Zixibacteria bacterium]|nr:hypothetical protein [candidate division Zixibacteria bacterium]